MTKTKASKKEINPQKTYGEIFNQNLDTENVFPRLIRQVRFDSFRQIRNLTINFTSPVTVVSGTNRCGKTTILLSIACSHFDFKKRNYSNGKLERQTWSNVLKSVDHDKQNSDWTYHLQIKTGAKLEERRGQRKLLTKKWNGLGKKESQIVGVAVVYLDLDRILPARYYSSVLQKNAQKATGTDVSTIHQKYIETCLSYIFEETYFVQKLFNHNGRDIFGFSNGNKYSSLNSASGEDVLSRILIDCIEAPQNSLILIDELELGLHPKIQRRLMDIIFHISLTEQKQFVITSHSSTVISSVPESSRIFIDNNGSTQQVISPISINAALSKMDSECYPLIDLFCEDDIAERIINKAKNNIQSQSIDSRLINVIVSGSATDTYLNFLVRTRIYSKVSIKSGHSCVLDGDMQNLLNKNGQHQFPAQDGLFFLLGNDPPEKILCDSYESQNQNSKLRYHIKSSNVHCLFDKMIELGLFTNIDAAFEASWAAFISTTNGTLAFQNLIDFLVNECRRYSPDL